LPCVLLLLDYWPLMRLQLSPGGWTAAGRRAVLEKLPLFALVLAWCFIAFLTQRQIKALPSLERYPLDVRIYNALQAYVSYIGKMLWPSRLAAYYPHPGDSVSALHALGAGLLLVAITAAVIGPGRRRPYLAVGWFWYLGTLVPLIGLVQIGAHGMADRYTYVPLIGLFLALTWGIADVVTAGRLPRLYLLASGTTVVLITCTMLTSAQLAYWRSDLELWEHTLQVTEHNAMAYNNRGMHYYRAGDIDVAQSDFARAVVIDSKLPLYHCNLGN